MAGGSAGAKMPCRSGPMSVSARGSPRYSSPPGWLPSQSLAKPARTQEDEGRKFEKLGAVTAQMRAMSWPAKYTRPEYTYCQLGGQAS